MPLSTAGLSCRRIILFHPCDLIFFDRTKPCHLPIEEVVTFMPPLHFVSPLRPFLDGPNQTMPLAI